jgi:hypothetical protein
MKAVLLLVGTLTAGAAGDCDFHHLCVLEEMSSFLWGLGWDEPALIWALDANLELCSLSSYTGAWKLGRLRVGRNTAESTYWAKND